MKQVLLICILLISVGCAKETPTPPVPGAINTFDSTSYRALMDAQAAINSFKADIASGKLTETPTIKTVLNQVIQDYDAADALWQQYHASAGTAAQPPVQAAITKLQTDINGLAGAK
jgi:hypothetical protein